MVTVLDMIEDFPTWTILKTKSFAQGIFLNPELHGEVVMYEVNL